MGRDKRKQTKHKLQKHIRPISSKVKAGKIQYTGCSMTKDLTIGTISEKCSHNKLKDDEEKNFLKIN